MSVSTEDARPFRRLPPAYEEEESTTVRSTVTTALLSEKPAPQSQFGEIIHYVQPGDTVASLSLHYSVPVDVLRKSNNIFSDHLLAARRTVIIPPGFFAGTSRNPLPPGGMEEDQKRVKVKRFQVATKCVESKVAEFYLMEASWDLERALLQWAEDDEWEKKNAGGRRRSGAHGSSRGRRGWSGQL